jgi:hypothetical protein
VINLESSGVETSDWRPRSRVRRDGRQGRGEPDLVSQGFEHRPALAADWYHHRHLDLLITGAIAKWAIFSPIFVPAPVPPTATSSAIDSAASAGDASDDGDYDANDYIMEYSVSSALKVS